MAHPTIHHSELEQLIACPSCDALYRVEAPQHGERAVCGRCHHVLIAPIKGAVIRVVALALTIVLLIGTAVFMPFLKIEASGFSHSTSIFDAALSFSAAHMVGLSFVVMALIVFIPIARAMLLIYVLVPLLFHRRPFPGARMGFRMSEELRPWSMAEIFVLGVGVAFVKVADMARVELGAAFWMFAILVVITVMQDGFLCRWSIWTALEAGHPDPTPRLASRGDTHDPEMATATVDPAHG